MLSVLCWSAGVFGPDDELLEVVADWLSVDLKFCVAMDVPGAGVAVPSKLSAALI